MESTWSRDAAVRLMEAGESLAEAIRTHASTIASLVEARDDERVFFANSSLLPFALAYADAQGSLTGTFFPFGLLRDFDEHPWDDAALPGLGEVNPDGIERVSVTGRWDFVVRDATALRALAAEKIREVNGNVGNDESDDDCNSDASALASLIDIDGVAQYPGLERAGEECVVGPTARTLNEMSPQERRRASVWAQRST